MYVDSHCHLAFPDFEGRVPELRAAMRAARVDAALVICTTLEEFPAVHAIAQAHPELWATVGVHPDNEGVREPSTDDLIALSREPRVIAIGETGLDYYRLNGRSIDDMAWQRDRFVAHIHAAVATGLPLVIHTRSASDDTLAILAREGAGRVRGVFHCFTETQEVAQGALDLGFHVSFSGILTFRNAQALRDVARMVPDGPPADRDRQPVPGASAASWQDQPAGLRRARRAAGGRAERHRGRRCGDAHHAQLRGAVQGEGAQPCGCGGVDVKGRATATAPTRRVLVLAAVATCVTPRSQAGSYEDFFGAIDVNDASKLRNVLAKGFDVNSVDPKGQRALYLAVRAGSRDAFLLLMAQPGIEVDVQNAPGETALMMAALRDNLEAAQALAARGAATHKDGWAPVHYASTGPGSNVLRWLIEKGAPLEARAPGGNTPLLMAARFGADRSIELLLERGADKSARNDRGQGAVELAKEAKRDEWVKRFGGGSR